MHEWIMNQDIAFFELVVKKLNIYAAKNGKYAISEKFYNLEMELEEIYNQKTRDLLYGDKMFNEILFPSDSSDEIELFFSDSDSDIEDLDLDTPLLCRNDPDIIDISDSETEDLNSSPDSDQSNQEIVDVCDDLQNVRVTTPPPENHSDV